MCVLSGRAWWALRLCSPQIVAPPDQKLQPDSGKFKRTVIEAYQAFAGAVELVNNPVEDTPTLKVGPELGVNVGFRLIHRADVFDPDTDETLFVKINWGDG